MIKSSHIYHDLSSMRLKKKFSVQSRIHGTEWLCGDRIYSDGVPDVRRAAAMSHLCGLGSLFHYQRGNLSMIVLSQSDPCLQIPRYSLSHLSFLDICYS